MFEDNVLERGAPALQEVESPQSVPALPHEPDAQPWKQDVVARHPLQQESPAPERPVSPAQLESQPRATKKERRNGFLRRRPIISAIGAMLLASAVGGGYLYLDYA